MPDQPNRPKAADESLADDVLYGAKAIGRFIGKPARSVYHQRATSRIPYYKSGSTICLRRSTYLAYIKAEEEKSMNRR